MPDSKLIVNLTRGTVVCEHTTVADRSLGRMRGLMGRRTLPSTSGMLLRPAPAVWALEALPLYDAIARMKVQAHWQTDVLAGWAIGTAAGYYAHARDNPLVLGVMPHGIVVGVRHQF